MSDIRIKKRKRMREKDAKNLSSVLEEAAGAPVFGEGDPVDTAESTDYGLIFVGGDIIGLVFDEKPFLTIRGILRYRPTKRYVTVDMGAVPFISNGADVMGPGITDADPEIREGDMVWIRDVRNGAPLGVGVSLRPASELSAKMPGKAVRTIHYIGDKLWKSGE
ncbi:MAG: PUA domain-containing protein [Candidatus Methanomethylophilaceae archaeon]|jgi:PUA domain protein